MFVIEGGHNAIRARQLTAAIGAARDLGIEVSQDIEAELKNYRELNRYEQTAQAEYDQASLMLDGVEPHEFATAQDNLVNALTKLQVVKRGELKDAFAAAIVGRLSGPVKEALPGWESQVVQRFNSVVADYELNEVAQHLPDVTDHGSFKLLGLSDKSLDAISKWRSASDYLHPLWDAYQKIATVRHVELGPRQDAHDINVTTACCIGDPGENRNAGKAAMHFAYLASGGDAMNEYRQLSPFIVAPLSGYKLHLNTHMEAVQIRLRLKRELYGSVFGGNPTASTTWV